MSSCQRILVRNLPHDVTEIDFLTYLSQRKSCAALFESDSSPQAVLSSFKPGKAPNALKGRAAVSATAFLLVESPSHAQLVAAALDSIAFRPTTDPQLLMTVEYSASQEPPTPGTVRQSSNPQDPRNRERSAVAPDSIFLDSDYMDFLTKHNLNSATGRGADIRGSTAPSVDKESSSQQTPVAATSAASPDSAIGASKGHTTAVLEKWLEDQKAEAESRRSTALVQAMLGKWYRNIPFSWEQRRSVGGNGGGSSAKGAAPSAEKKERRKKSKGTSASVGAVGSSSLSSKSRSAAAKEKDGATHNGNPGKKKSAKNKEKNQGKRKDSRANPGNHASSAQEVLKTKKPKKSQQHDRSTSEPKEMKSRRKQTAQPRVTGLEGSVAQEHQPHGHVDPSESQRKDSSRKRSKQTANPAASASQQPIDKGTAPVSLEHTDDSKPSRRKKDKQRAASRADAAKDRMGVTLVPEDTGNAEASQCQSNPRLRTGKKAGKHNAATQPATTEDRGEQSEVTRAHQPEADHSRKKARQDAPPSTDLERTGRRSRRHVSAPAAAVADSGSNDRGGDGSRQGFSAVGDPVVGPSKGSQKATKSREEEILDAHATREQKTLRAKEKEVRTRRQEQLLREANEQLRRRSDPSDSKGSTAVPVALASTPAHPPSSSQPASGGSQQRNKFSVTLTTQRGNIPKSSSERQHRDPAAAPCDDAMPIPAPRRVVLMRRGGEAAAGASTGSTHPPSSQHVDV